MPPRFVLNETQQSGPGLVTLSLGATATTSNGPWSLASMALVGAAPAGVPEGDTASFALSGTGLDIGGKGTRSESRTHRQGQESFVQDQTLSQTRTNVETSTQGQPTQGTSSNSGELPGEGAPPAGPPASPAATLTTVEDSVQTFHASGMSQPVLDVLEREGTGTFQFSRFSVTAGPVSMTLSVEGEEQAGCFSLSSATLSATGSQSQESEARATYQVDGVNSAGLEVHADIDLHQESSGQSTFQTRASQLRADGELRRHEVAATWAPPVSPTVTPSEGLAGSASAQGLGGSFDLGSISVDVDVPVTNQVGAWQGSLSGLEALGSIRLESSVVEQTGQENFTFEMHQSGTLDSAAGAAQERHVTSQATMVSGGTGAFSVRQTVVEGNASFVGQTPRWTVTSA